MNKFKLIIPTIVKDFERSKIDYNTYFEYLSVKEIIFIGPKALGDIINSNIEAGAYSGKVSFIDENELLNTNEVSEYFKRRFLKIGIEVEGFPGWYYQQFLKIKYATVCDDEYYLVWDSDTIPLKKAVFFDEENHPYFNIKNEYIPNYFVTIRNLFDGQEKVLSTEDSFVAEHMVISTQYMRQMISDIEKSTFPGTHFYEKIIEAIENPLRGFSEFETFGTYMMAKYPDVYKLKRWKSLRAGAFFYKIEDLTKEEMEWLGKDFDAITFESYNEYREELAALFHDEEFRCSMSAGEIYEIIINSEFFEKGDNGAINPQ